MSSSTRCSRVTILCGLLLLLVLVSVPRWNLAASEFPHSDVDLTLTQDSGELTNSVGMKLVAVRAGKFDMGAPANEAGAGQDERPQHVCEISKDYFIGVTEVTQKQYKAVMGNNPSQFSPTGGRAGNVQGMKTDDFPVDNASWDDAVAFIAKLNGLAAEARYRVKYRLPTEAEWEYACRGGHHVKRLGDKARLPFHFKQQLGSLGFGQANFESNQPYNGGKNGNGLNRTCLVGQYEPNALSIYDMHGNLWEWCNDWYGNMAYSDKNRRDPQGPNNGAERVIRGGSWGNGGSDCRAARRVHYGGGNRSEYVGFRIAASPR